MAKDDLRVAFTFRLTPKQHAKLRQAAEARGMLLTAFIRHAAVIVADEPVRRGRAA
jgi:uncharacterized protein (DUF1778 family)